MIYTSLDQVDEDWAMALPKKVKGRTLVKKEYTPIKGNLNKVATKGRGT